MFQTSGDSAARKPVPINNVNRSLLPQFGNLAQYNFTKCPADSQSDTCHLKPGEWTYCRGQRIMFVNVEGTIFARNGFIDPGDIGIDLTQKNLL